jgi:hypothetical protein
MGLGLGRLTDQAFFLFRYLSFGCSGCPEGKNIQEKRVIGGSSSREIEASGIVLRRVALGIGKDMKDMKDNRTETPRTRQDLTGRKNNLK